MEATSANPAIYEAGQFLFRLFGLASEDLYVLIWTLPDKLSHWVKIDQLRHVNNAVTCLVESSQNIYCGVALSPSDYGRHARCKAESVAGIVGLWADMDLLDPVHKKKNLPPTIEDARSVINSMGAIPTATVFSGHGIQAWWLFKEPWLFDDAEDPGKSRLQASELIRKWNTHLNRKARQHNWTLDATHDLARVMRVPGTINFKDGAEPKQVTILEADWGRRYEPDDLEILLPAKGEEEDAALNSRVNRDDYNFALSSDANPPFQKFMCLQEIEPKFMKSWKRTRKDLYDDSPSVHDLALAAFAYQADWTDQEVANLIIACRRENGEDLKIRDYDTYYIYTLDRAKKSVKRMRATQQAEEVISEVECAIMSDNAQERKEAEAKLLSTLTDMLGFQVRGFVKYPANDPLFRLQTNNDSILLGTAGSILDLTTFRKKVAGLSGHVIPISKGLRSRWDAIAQMIFKTCKVEELGEEATETGAGRNWILAYMSDKPPTEQLEEAAETKCPFVYGHEIGFFEEDLRQWLAVKRNEKFSSKALGAILRVCGCQPRSANIIVNNKKTTRHVWILNDDMTTEALPQPE